MAAVSYLIVHIHRLDAVWSILKLHASAHAQHNYEWASSEEVLKVFFPRGYER